MASDPFGTVTLEKTLKLSADLKRELQASRADFDNTTQDKIDILVKKSFTETDWESKIENHLSERCIEEQRSIDKTQKSCVTAGIVAVIAIMTILSLTVPALIGSLLAAFATTLAVSMLIFGIFACISGALNIPKELRRDTLNKVFKEVAEQLAEFTDL